MTESIILGFTFDPQKYQLDAIFYNNASLHSNIEGLTASKCDDKKKVIKKHTYLIIINIFKIQNNQN